MAWFSATGGIQKGIGGGMLGIPKYLTRTVLSR